MNKQDIVAFFDRCAPNWDAELIKSDVIIGKILDNAEIGPGQVRLLPRQRGSSQEQR